VKQNLKPTAYKLSEQGATLVMACLLQNEPASYSASRVKWPRATQPQRKRVPQGVLRKETWRGVDPKPSDLPMARVKSR
jgi:hypothetical protein